MSKNTYIQNEAQNGFKGWTKEGWDFLLHNEQYKTVAISSLAKILEQNDEVEFIYNNLHYEIFASADTGYVVNIYSSDEKGKQYSSMGFSEFLSKKMLASHKRMIFGTIKKIATKDKKVGLFLVAFFLYIDGVGTIIDNCINIGTDLKLDSVGQVVFLLFTQIVACIGSLVFGRLSQTYKTTTLLYVCIAGYFAVCLYALTLHDLIGFGIMAFGVGCFQGSLQALSRSYFSKIIPPENSGEYFGIYDIFAKGASFLGSLVIASVKLAGGTINVAVATMAIFFAVGFVFLRLADRYDAPRRENN
jgi:MFS-type transporter involved in bile tolerance (Atg22 family)